MNKRFYLIALAVIGLCAPGCGQNKDRSHKPLTQHDRDSLRVADSLKTLMLQYQKRAANPETDSLLFGGVTVEHNNGMSMCWLAVDVRNETQVKTWKFAQILFHVTVGGKETQVIQAYPVKRSDYRQVDNSLLTQIPPNLTVHYQSQNPVSDPNTHENSKEDFLMKNAKVRVEIRYNSAVQIAYGHEVNQETLLTLVAVNDRTMKSVGTFQFTNSAGDTTFYCDSQDSCVANGKPAALFPEQWQADVKPEFRKKKYKVTYTIDNSGNGNKNELYINVKKMVLIN